MKYELEGLLVGFLPLGYILWACQVIYLHCTADIVEDKAQCNAKMPTSTPLQAAGSLEEW